MIRRSSCAALLLFFLADSVSIAQPQEQFPTGPKAGKELAEQLREMRLEPNTEMRGTLKILGREKKVPLIPFVFRTSDTSNGWSLTYETGSNAVVAAEKLTVIHTANASNRYEYAVAPAPGAPLGPVKILTGTNADIPLAGTDFWLSDLGFEFYHFPGQNRLKGELRSSVGCFVLESTNTNAAPGGYARVKSWITKEQNALLHADSFGTDGKTLKSFEVDSVKKGQVRSLIIYNRKIRSRTILEFEEKKE
jgi:hypothetical protein